MWRSILIFAFIAEALCNIFDLTEFDDPLSVFYNSRNALTRQHHGRCTGTLNANLMEGICLSRPECHFSSGNVAATGDCTLGICCVYTSGCNQRSNKRISYFNQTGTVDSSCTYTVDVENSNICQMRIDFEALNLAPTSSIPIGASPPDIIGYRCIDEYFEVTSPKINYIPTICGNNNGQHMYVPVDRLQNQMIMKVVVNTALTSVSRNWRIKVTQLECPGPSKHQKSQRSYIDSRLIAPAGCLQYHLTSTGEIRSFGYDNTTIATAATAHYPPNMDYAICFRRFSDTCGIQFTINTFNVGGAMGSLEAEDCADQDFLFIPDGMVITTGEPPVSHNKYCGTESDPTTAVGKIIISTTPGPLYIRFKTNGEYFTPNDGLVPGDVEYETGFSLTYLEKKGNTCL